MTYSQSLMSISTVILLLLLSFPFQIQAKCKKGCDLALASYYLGQGSNLTYISNLFGQTIQNILNYNPHVSNESNLLGNTRINIPFACNCLNGEFLGHTFPYVIQSEDTYSIVAQTVFSNLTTIDWLERVNRYKPTQLPDHAPINVTVNCSCGNRDVSRDYGLFVTYPLRLEDNLTSVAAESGVPERLLEKYNSGVDFGGGSGLVFVPAKAEYGNFPPMKLSTGKPTSLICGISVAAAAVVLLLVVFFYSVMYRKQKAKESTFVAGSSNEHFISQGQGSSFKKASESMSLVSRSSPRLKEITLDKSVEFTYEELAKATDGFCLANKIGRGGFGSVYYAKLRGEKVAIKKMDTHASKEFLAELKVLTRVHHLNLVRLIGYCVEGALFLVYEFIENGNLSQHLRDAGREPLHWLARVQIALDAARGLEYIHEHTVPVYIHRDIKPANILIDKKLRGKVADFGLSKLAEYGNASLHTRLVGTFGYLSPEYAQYGDVSPKVDVYAFGVVLYELISAKEAVIKSNEPSMEAKGLVALFEEVLSKPNPEDALHQHIDPRLGDNYPLDSLHKMALLAKACTQDNPQLRPSMRSIVVALMTLSSSLEECDAGSFCENHSQDNLVIGR